MFKFQNNTTKENFKKYIEYSGQTIEQVKTDTDLNKKWKVSDKFGNVWLIVFNNNVNEFSISNVTLYNEPPFCVDIISSGNNIEICKAKKNGRNITSERLLKQFSNLAMMVNCYNQFGYLKL